MYGAKFLIIAIGYQMNYIVTVMTNTIILIIVHCSYV